VGFFVRARSLRLLVLASASAVLLGCQFNVGKGSGKPSSVPATSAPGSSSGKPVASTGKPTTPAAEDPAPTDDGPVRTSDPEPGPVRTSDPGPGPTRTSGEPQRVAGDPEAPARAVCSASDEVLESVCHLAFDPIAANDDEAFLASLSDTVVLVRPGPDGRAERASGKTRLHREMRAAGGLAELVHVRPGTRVVGTIVRDCRRCAKSYVAVQANTRAGRIIVTTDTSSPPRITQLELRPDPAPVREKGVR
jgi:hypothetical protein